MKQPLGVFNYPNEKYHSSDGISRSKLWKFKNLPYRFWYECLSGQYVEPADKESFVLGDLVHTLVLEPEKAAERYTASPDFDRRTKQGKIDYLEFLEKSEGKTVVKPDLLNQATQMAKAVMLNSTVGELFFGARMEQSIYWEHEPTGILCKARPDAWRRNIVLDLKTTQDAGYRSFQSSAYKYGYFLQAAMIYEALKSVGEPFEKFIFICVEKTAPYPLGIYMLDDEALQFGLEMFHSLMSRLAECYEKDVWPDYGIQKLTIPKYASMEIEIE